MLSRVSLQHMEKDSVWIKSTFGISFPIFLKHNPTLNVWVIKNV